MSFDRKYDYDQVFQFIVGYKRQHDGNSPGYRQIMDGCGISSTSVVAYILDTLQGQGLITVDGPSRHILVTGGRWEVAQ